MLFRDDLDYSAHLRLLVKTADRYEAGIRDYCLMPNHVHLLLDLRHENLAELMQYLLARHVERFNRRHLRRGHLVQAPYRPKPIEDEPHLFRTNRYIALNPVRAGLCEHPLEWPWSAYSGDGRIAPSPSRAVIELVADALRRSDFD